MKILILYSELAEYTLACISKLIDHKTEIHVVYWPVKSEAPFKFRSLDSVKFHERNSFTKNELVSFSLDLKPNIVICSGWMDKDYVATCRALFDVCPTVLTLDNHWIGDLKQTIKTLFAKHYFKKIFSHAWVPGKPQIPFVKKLGFKDNFINTGFYSADLDLFKPKATDEFNYNLLYVGRYAEFKGIFELWTAFSKFTKTSKNPWTLHSIGTGDLWDKRVNHDRIIHHGFLQPKELNDIVKTCDVFILPSRKEPWGVVVHEMAASGLVLMCSDKIGAATEFLIEDKNGFIFKHNDSESIVESLNKLDQKTNKELIQMGKKSVELSESITPNQWASTVLKISKE